MQNSFTDSFPHHRFQGCLYMLAAMFCFAVMNVLIRLLSQDISTTQIVFLRNALSLLLLIPWVIYAGPQTLRTGRASGHFWRAALGIISMELWFHTLAVMNLSQATALSFSTPILVTLAAIFVLKEQVDWKRMLAILVGLAGTLVIVNPGGGGLDWTAVLALISFAITATTSILVKTLTRTERAGTIVFYMALFMTPLSAGPAWLYWMPLSNYNLLIGFGLAFFSTCGHFLLTRAYSSAEMTVIIPIDYTRLLFTAIFAYMLFGEAMGLRTMCGAALVVTGAVLSATINAQQMRQRIAEEELSDVKE